MENEKWDVFTTLREYVYEYAWNYGRYFHAGNANGISTKVGEKMELPEKVITEEHLASMGIVSLDKVKETIWSHYSKNGGYTRTAAMFIEKLTGQKWERDEEYDRLVKENAELRSALDEARKQIVNQNL